MRTNIVKVLITGANGFVGKNLQLHLAERHDVHVVCFTRGDDTKLLTSLLSDIDFVFHLAGTNRPKDPHEFTKDNLELTQALCQALAMSVELTGQRPPVIYTSSIQAEGVSVYGESKRMAENALFALSRTHQVPVHVFRLPNVFGKWCKPNYNSAVATFCHNIANGLPIQINDPTASVTLVHVDDVIARFMQLMDGTNAYPESVGFESVSPQYSTNVGALASQIQAFKDSRTTLVTERVGTGLVRALYSTYISYLPVESFSYSLSQHMDTRGVFVEMLKTLDSGQFSFFTAHPGITRGGHYHHAKTEKFLVISGQARFGFRHMQTGQFHEIRTSGDKPEVVETVPGWTHDITNTGTSDLIVMLWANEVFDRARPDTFACSV
jgi:UDP-2-acetamido-2,6-beta-L-arabino-hexul-4-ose reductase